MARVCSRGNSRTGYVGWLSHAGVVRFAAAVGGRRDCQACRAGGGVGYLRYGLLVGAGVKATDQHRDRWLRGLEGQSRTSISHTRRKPASSRDHAAAP